VPRLDAVSDEQGTVDVCADAGAIECARHLAAIMKS
jgi:hypothetical protein